MPPKPKRSGKTKKISRPAEQKGKREKAPQEQNKPVERRTLTPRFKAIFLAVFSITLLSLLGYITLTLIAAIYSIDSPTLDGSLETLKTAFISGFGAIVGLLGGKAL